MTRLRTRVDKLENAGHASAEALAPDLSVSSNQPTQNQEIPANTSCIVARQFTIPLGVNVTIDPGANLVIL